MYKEASKMQLRVATSRGELSVEQLWSLPLTELDQLAVNLEKEYKESNSKSFLIKKTAKNKTTKLKFDIVLDILSTKVDERDAQQEAQQTKEHNQKIMALIQKKQEGELEGKSIKELQEMLKG